MSARISLMSSDIFNASLNFSTVKKRIEGIMNEKIKIIGIDFIQRDLASFFHESKFTLKSSLISIHIPHKRYAILLQNGRLSKRYLNVMNDNSRGVNLDSIEAMTSFLILALSAAFF